MPINGKEVFKIFRQSMDHYWKVVYSKTDEGLDATELKWKRKHEADIKRWSEVVDRVFGKGCK